MATTHYSTLTYKDATGESSTMKVYNDAITALSIGGFLTQLGAFKTATDALVLGNRTRSAWIGDYDTLSNDPASNNYAQRENKLLVSYKDTTTDEEYELTIPTVDLALLTFIPGAKDAVQFAGAGVNAAVTAWVTAFEAFASPPEAPGNAVQVTAMRFVGRNT
jgi:hypothetical protein